MFYIENKGHIKIYLKFFLIILYIQTCFIPLYSLFFGICKYKHTPKTYGVFKWLISFRPKFYSLKFKIDSTKTSKKHCFTMVQWNTLLIREVMTRLFAFAKHSTVVGFTSILMSLFIFKAHAHCFTWKFAPVQWRVSVVESDPCV